MTDNKDIISMVEVQLRNFIESRRPKDAEVRKKLDFGYNWDGQTALLFEIRPQWNNPANILHIEFAKIKYIKSSKQWKLYWRRASGKWEAYEPIPSSDNLQELINEISHDGYGYFFG